MKNRSAVNPALDEHATDGLFAESPPPGMDGHGGGDAERDKPA